jgi:hypothetical protein
VPCGVVLRMERAGRDEHSGRRHVV